MKQVSLPVVSDNDNQVFSSGQCPATHFSWCWPFSHSIYVIFIYRDMLMMFDHALNNTTYFQLRITYRLSLISFISLWTNLSTGALKNKQKIYFVLIPNITDIWLISVTFNKTNKEKKEKRNTRIYECKKIEGLNILTWVPVSPGSPWKNVI